MNIGLLVNFKWYPLKGGGKVHIYQVVQQLTRRGHRFHSIFYYDQAPQVKVYRQRQLFQFLKNVDLLYVRVDGQFGMEKLTCLKFLKMMRLPVIWEINAPVEEMIIRGKSPHQVRWWSIQRKCLARWVDAAICVSKEMEQYAKKQLGIKRVIYIPNGSDKVLFSPQKRDEAVYSHLKGQFKVIWAGCAYYAWQGWDIIIDVAQKMQEIDKDIVFIFVTQIEEVKNRDRLPSNIVLIDTKDYLEMPPYLASADAGLCLYHLLGGKSSFYFSPLKLYDYMASSLPIIATDVGQISEVIKDGHNAFLVDNGIDQIIEKILFLKNNPREAQRMGQSARKTVEDYYNWDRVGQETEKILLELTHKETGK